MMFFPIAPGLDFEIAGVSACCFFKPPMGRLVLRYILKIAGLAQRTPPCYSRSVRAGRWSSPATLVCTHPDQGGGGVFRPPNLGRSGAPDMAVYSNYRSTTDGAGFTIDAGEQREKARRAAQILDQQTQQREQWLRQNPQLRHQLAYEIAAENADPPPVLQFAEDPAAFPNGRSPSFTHDRRAARFRDTHLYGPPPPLPARSSTR